MNNNQKLNEIFRLILDGEIPEASKLINELDYEKGTKLYKAKVVLQESTADELVKIANKCCPVY